MKPLFKCLSAGLVALLLVACSKNLGVDQHGKTVSESDLAGHWLVINYWAEWCGPCRNELPQLNVLSEQMADKGVRVIGVNYDGLQGERLSQSAEKLGIRFTVLATDPAQRFGLPRSQVLPVTYLVDDKGVLRDQRVGEQTAEGLAARLAELRR